MFLFGVGEEVGGMRKNVQQIFTENAEVDQWQLMRQFAYSANIKRFLSTKGIDSPDEKLVESIAGTIEQAYEYFIASKSATINISPLLMYYGASNLLYGVCCLISSRRLQIESHGMSIDNASVSKGTIADTIFVLQNIKNGALENFYEVIQRQTLSQKTSWTLLEVFGSIPDLREDFENCYANAVPFTIPLQMIKRKKDSVETVSKDALMRFGDLYTVLRNIEGFDSSYLAPQWSTQETHLILRKRLGCHEIGEFSTSGQKFLQIGHRKNGKLITPALPILLLMGLYVLATLSRYHSHIWSPFVRNDTTGERLFIEKFLTLARRAIPNLMLNELMEKRLIFMNEQQGIIQEPDEQDQEEIRNLIREEIKHQSERE